MVAKDSRKFCGFEAFSAVSSFRVFRPGKTLKNEPTLGIGGVDTAEKCKNEILILFLANPKGKYYLREW